MLIVSYKKRYEPYDDDDDIIIWLTTYNYNSNHDRNDEENYKNDNFLLFKREKTRI